MKKFTLPDIGEGVKNVLVTDILISNNQSVKKNDIVVIVESEKASMEIPIDFDCNVTEILVKKGDSINPGDAILTYSSSGKIDEKSKVDDVKSIDKKDEGTINDIPKSDNAPIEKISISNESNVYASPSVRKIARELDCDLSNISGSGKNGRITADDVYSHIKQSDVSNVDENKNNDLDDVFEKSSKWGLTEKVELNNIKRTTARRLTDSWNKIPHVTQFDECDITKLDKIRKVLKRTNKDSKIKVSFIPFFIKAIYKTIKELSVFNSSLSSGGKFLIQKKYYNVGIAVNTERGLVVPVIKDVNNKSIKQLSKELTEIINKAKNKRLSIEDLSGGCITISSLGGISGKFFTPIINPPEVAILGISKIQIKPMLINNKFTARKMLPLSLSYDHRVVDGADAAEFTKLFSFYISNPNELLDE